MEAETAHNPARISPLDPARSRLKPLGFVDTGTLAEGYANLIGEGDSFEARTHCVDERNFKFRKD